MELKRLKALAGLSESHQMFGSKRGEVQITGWGGSPKLDELQSWAKGFKKDLEQVGQSTGVSFEARPFFDGSTKYFMISTSLSHNADSFEDVAAFIEKLQNGLSSIGKVGTPIFTSDLRRHHDASLAGVDAFMKSLKSSKAGELHNYIVEFSVKPKAD